ncbi:isopeptide-forming domain-containing fimbrial protein [Streptococcus ictaluri]|uniref:Repeat protein n=1 Tax=Streptococcus ictaluri 707-05 TaxID=764299 RepID=G5K4P6_9STRE|nr:isopeptide-forming domain-containing fimbrial protein [Streptococcus ictaluri]EHI68989.1 repeat protein [Streptococcus ictaluri 707-05]
MREKIMQNLKKILVTFLAILAVVGLGMGTVSALSKDDTAELKITNIEGKPTVTLYKIGEGEYSERGDSFVRFKFIKGVVLSEDKPTSTEINKIANDINRGTVKAELIDKQENIIGAYNYRVTGASVYIANIITGAEDGRTYNPILLTASYTGEGVIKAGEVSVTDHYLYGETVVAKSSQPFIKKHITKSSKDDNRDTASVGEKIDFKLTIQLPNYSKEATNKTVFVSDAMSQGLTFLSSSLVINWNSQTLRAKNNRFEYNNKTIAELSFNDNSFHLNFNYDNLENHAPEVIYSALLNEKAIVGKDGNSNNVEYYLKRQHFSVQHL